jgi:hypothetical protein
MVEPAVMTAAARESFVTAIKKLCRRRVLRITVAGFCLWLSAMTGAGMETAAGPPAWRMIADTAQGRLFHRSVVGSSIPEAMIAARLDAPPGRVHALVTDYDHFAEFIPNVAESRVLRQAGDIQWVYHHLHFGGPVADRVYVIESRDAASHPPENHYRVEWTLSDRRFPVSDAGAGVRPRSFSGFWELRPLEGGAATEAVYGVHSDPGGLIPDWLVVKMTDRYIQQVIAAVRQRLAHTE